MSGMFSQIPHALIRDESVTLGAIKTWHAVYLLTLGKRPGWNLTKSQIAEFVGLPASTVRDALNWLIEHGWLERHPGPKGAPNIYMVCREPFVGMADTTPESLAGGTAHRAPQGNGEAPGGDTAHRVTPDGPPVGGGDGGPYPPIELQPREQHSPPPDGTLSLVVADDGSSKFDEWWALYPRKVDKGAARREWPGAVRKVGADALIASLTRQLPEMRRQDRLFIKYPSTWLRNDCWENVPERSYDAYGEPRTQYGEGRTQWR